MFKKTLVIGILGIAGLCFAKGTETAVGTKTIGPAEIKKAQEEVKSASIGQKGTQITEEYIRKELISFGWGDGEYELGSNWKEFLDEKGDYIGPEDAWCESVGPRAIKVNNKGEIFVWDGGNKRILIFNNKGKLINKMDLYTEEFCYMPHSIEDFTFDEQNNIYFLWDTGPLWYGECEKITKFTSKLKFDRDLLYKSQKPSEFTPKRIEVADNGEIYIFNTRKDKIIALEPKREEIEKEYRGRKYKYFPLVLKRENKILEQKDGKIKILSPKTLKGRTINFKKQNKFDWAIDIIKEDVQGNVFILAGSFTKNETVIALQKKTKYFVHKYNPKGEFVSKILLDRDNRLFFVQDSIEAFVDVSMKGDVYHLWIQKEGPKLIKWGKVSQ